MNTKQFIVLSEVKWYAGINGNFFFLLLVLLSFLFLLNILLLFIDLGKIEIYFRISFVFTIIASYIFYVFFKPYSERGKIIFYPTSIHIESNGNLIKLDEIDTVLIKYFGYKGESRDYIGRRTMENGALNYISIQRNGLRKIKHYFLIKSPEEFNGLADYIKIWHLKGFNQVIFKIVR